MGRPNYLREIKQDILASEDGTVFVDVDFVNVTDKNVNMALMRLEEGIILIRFWMVLRSWKKR